MTLFDAAMRRSCACVGAAMLLVVATNTFASPPAAPRQVVVPIRQTMVGHDVIRYSIPVTIGHTQVQAMLDTGSTGLRVLPGVLHAGDLTAVQGQVRYSYGSGVVLRGVVARARIDIGGMHAYRPIAIEAVASVGCTRRRPHCPASRIPQDEYRLGGNGQAGVGFEAIIGIGLRATPIGNPLPKIGASQWLIELPLPGSARPGALILDPDATVLAGIKRFATHRIGQPYDGIPGCLVDARTRQRICSPTLLDSGVAAKHVRVVLPNAGGSALRIRQGDTVRLQLGGDGSTLRPIEFVEGAADAPHVRITRARQRDPAMILAGSTPFLSYRVFYDYADKVIGLAPRNPH